MIDLRAIASVCVILFGNGCLLLLLRAVFGMRDALRDLVVEMKDVRKDIQDHESRLRLIERRRLQRPDVAGV